MTLSEFKKEVRINWKTWCGNLLPPDTEALSDGFSLFFRTTALTNLVGKEGEKMTRYDKLASQASYKRLSGLRVGIDTHLSKPLEVSATWRHNDKETVAELRPPHGGVPVVVNAERLRIALLVAGGDQLSLESSGAVIIGDDNGPRAKIAPYADPFKTLDSCQPRS